MLIRMKITTKGSVDGLTVNEYQAGEKYDLPEELARVFLDNNMAIEDKEMVIEKKEKKETKDGNKKRS